MLCLTGHTRAAGESLQGPKPHSLIHRQAPDVTTPEGAAPSAVPGTTAAAPRSLHRKLTKRPAPVGTAGAAAGSSQSSTTATSSPSTETIQPTRTLTDNRTSMSATGPAAVGSSLSMTATGAGAIAGASTAQPTTVKPLGATALAGIGAPSTALPGNAAVGRGLQRLATQLPGLTQLVAPTVSISSPPAPPAPGTSQPPTPQPPAAPAPSPQTTAPPSPAPPSGGSAALSWTLNSEADVAGYKVYVGTAPGLYTYPGSPFVVGLTNSYTLTGLPMGQTYFFAISAFDYSGSESGLSAEVSKSIY